MGDLGSLMLGGVMMTVSFSVKSGSFYWWEVSLFSIYDICCTGLLVFQAKGTKVFRQALLSPLLKNGHIAEPKVVVRYWIVGGIIGNCLIAIAITDRSLWLKHDKPSSIPLIGELNVL